MQDPFELTRQFFITAGPYLMPAWEAVKNWWWVPWPFLLFKPFVFLYLWWRVDTFLKAQKSMFLEIRIPKEILKPIRAMEVVVDHLWQAIYDPPDAWEKWVEGKVQLSYAFEIASIGGDVHFFIKIPTGSRDSIEAAIYSQYPEAEISEADDYTRFIPQDIPNGEWDLWGADYKALKPNPYPIKTYVDFETEHESKEEKRVDPMAELFEVMAKIKPGEQLWLQILAEPTTDKDFPWVTEGKKIRDELARRTKKEGPERKSLLMEAADVLITGEPPKEPPKEEKEIIPSEMKLTPGERDVITAVERKISKRGFLTTIRFIYLGQKDVFFKPKLRLIMSYFSAFFTQNLNGLVPYGQPYMTKIKKSLFPLFNLFIPRRLYLKKRSIFRKYRTRSTVAFPKPSAWPSPFVLNTEEMATIFHFPGKISAPAPFVGRIDAKKGEAPSGLPVE
jgi:hypothetical protein